VNTNQSSNPSTTKQIVISVAAGLILAAILGFIGFIYHKSTTQSAPPAQGSILDSGSSSDSPSALNASPTANVISPSTDATSTAPGLTHASVTASATRPVPQYLADMTPLPDEVPAIEPVQMGGIFYAHAVSTSSGGCARNQQNTFSYVINSKYTLFQATIGLDDQSVDGIDVQIEVIVDGRTLFSRTFTAGQISHVKRSIAGVRELKLEQTYLGPSPDICSSNATAVWGNAQVVP